jgi:outer membrane protein assembly factor BamB
MLGVPMRTLLIRCLAWTLCACAEPAPSSPDGGFQASLLVSRYDSVIVQYAPGDNRLLAWSPAGKVLWSTPLPAGEQVVSRPCVAPDSTVYLRGTKGVYALTVDGKLAWDYAIAPFEGMRELGAPAPMRNSGVALAVAPNTVVALAPDGVEMWRHRLSRNRTLRSAPIVGPSGYITLATSDSLLQLGDDGLVVWDPPGAAAR